MPVAWCLANPNQGEREVAEGCWTAPPARACCAPAWSSWPTRGWPAASWKRWSGRGARPWPARTGLMSPTGSARWVGSGTGWRRSSGGGDHRHPQRSARPGTSRRPHRPRPLGPGRPAAAGPGHRGLVQLADQRPGQALAGVSAAHKPFHATPFSGASRYRSQRTQRGWTSRRACRHEVFRGDPKQSFWQCRR